MNRFMVGGFFSALVAVIAFSFPTHLSANGPGDSVSQLVSKSMANKSSLEWHDDFNRGWKAARESGRPMVIFITSKHCRYCDAMKLTWCDQIVTQHVKRQFVAIRLSPGRNAETLNRIDVPAYPTTLIGHPDGHIVDHRIGFQPAHEMAKFLESAKQSLH